jgi:hypothetical protein
MAQGRPGRLINTDALDLVVWHFEDDYFKCPHRQIARHSIRSVGRSPFVKGVSN